MFTTANSICRKNRLSVQKPWWNVITLTFLKFPNPIRFNQTFVKVKEENIKESINIFLFYYNILKLRSLIVCFFLLVGDEYTRIILPILYWFSKDIKRLVILVKGQKIPRHCLIIFDCQNVSFSNKAKRLLKLPTIPKHH